MSGATSGCAATAGFEDLCAAVLREVTLVFRSPKAPKKSDEEVRSAVQLLFWLLDHQVEDRSLDEIGSEIKSGLGRWFSSKELVLSAELYEQFVKFLLKTINLAEFNRVEAEAGGRPSAAKVSKALGVFKNRELSEFESCKWDEFPPPNVVGKPDFLEHRARVYVYRNLRAHSSAQFRESEKVQVVESFCVFLIWTVMKFGGQIRSALIRARFFEYLHRIRNDENFAPIARTCVELSARFCSPEEYRISNPLLPLAEAPSGGEEVEVSKLPETNRVTVIEAEAGAGKTTMLQFLAWREAGRLLDDTCQDVRVPVFVGFRHLNHCRQTIASAVEQNLASVPPVTVPWDRVLLLVDGLNEVGAEVRSSFTDEIKDLLRHHRQLRVVVTGRLNSFRGEFPAAAIVQLQPLNDRRLLELFQKVLQDKSKVVTALASVLQTPGLSALGRVPFYTAKLASLAQSGSSAALTSQAAIVRRCVRDFVNREEAQASAGVIRTDCETKELILARLAFDTKHAGEGEFSRMRARTIIADAMRRPATSLEVGNFLSEAADNHFLQQAGNESLKFTHDLYHDYFAARRLDADERSQKGQGVKHALDRFAEEHWQECIRLFAGLSGASRTLAECGAETNPLLAWVLVNDANLVDVGLNQTIALAAYSVFEGDLRKKGRAGLAGACLLVLTALGRADLVEQAVIRQRKILEPSELWKLSGNERNAEEKRIQEAMLPLGYGLISVLRLGTNEQRAGQEGRYCEASRAAIRGLKQIKAGRILTTILASWTGKTFAPMSLAPGAILKGIIEVGVDEVLDQEDTSLNGVLARWLARASEAGFSEAWPAYGRVLATYPGETPGVNRDVSEAAKWLRKSHESGDAKGSLQLALLLIEEPQLATIGGEGERLLRTLVQTIDDAKFQLGIRLLKGDGLPRRETEGLEFLLELAESGHEQSHQEIGILWLEWYVTIPTPGFVPPGWVMPLMDRLKGLISRKNSEHD